MLEILYTSLAGILALQIGLSLATVLLFVPFVQKRTIKTAFKRLNSSKGGQMAVSGKIDKALLKRAVDDLLSPDNPAGAILGLFPGVSIYLKQNPASVVGVVRMLDQFQNLGSFMGKMGKINRKPADLNNYNSYQDYK